jgi:myosin-1
LVASLGKCSPHYIRTIKPNDNKRANDYDEKRCAHQIQYLGLLENVWLKEANIT